MSKDLCEDMTVEIFSRLPTKSLLRFRALSKSLRALIGSPDFIRLHALRSPKTFLCVHHTRRKEKGKYRIKYVYTLHSEDQLPYNSYMYMGKSHPLPDPGIVASCNGIICYYTFGKRTVTLWNPSTRRVVTIHDSLSDIGGLTLYGFGFDPVINDYKILRISQPTSFVCTVKTRVWRKIVSPTTHFLKVTSCQCLFNGAVHWVVEEALSTPSDKCKVYYRIMTLDFTSEVFSSIELPEPTWEKSGLAVIQGSLAVISEKHNQCRIWIRWRESNNKAAFWAVAFNLNAFSCCSRVDRFYQDTINDDLLLGYGTEIKVYNPETHAQSQLANFSASSLVFRMFTYYESLELLDMEPSCYQGKQISKEKSVKM